MEPEPASAWEPGAGTGELAALHELVGVLRGQVEEQREELDARRREVSELHVLLERTQRLIPAPRESDDAGLREERDPTRERDQSRRRSWWARFWSGS